jgi:hypothetical protein
MDQVTIKEKSRPTTSRCVAYRGGDDRDHAREMKSCDGEGGSDHQDHADDHGWDHDGLHSRRPGPGQTVARLDRS